MILVTGATGNYGKSVIKFLLNKGVSPSNISALVRSEEKSADLKEKGIKLKVGDYSDYDSLLLAFEGIDKLLFVSGSDIMARTAQHKNIVKAAQSAKVKHIIYTSFIRNINVENSAIAYLQHAHLKTENWIKLSGINYTILQNAPYLENITLFLGKNVIDTGVISLPAKAGKSSAVLREELAEAAAQILTTGGHENKVYPLTNTDPYSFKEVADILSLITGNDIMYNSPNADNYRKTLEEFGVPKEYINLLTTFSVAQAEGDLELYNNNLKIILGRKPQTVKEYLEKVYLK
ncbi:NAD(P)H dehydrogenase (quinone) [Tenacibaculum sp. MAR_2009_124]|uniref:SDR family oxidoreductase n=1 Tax=Tenacibaculum sp. MAR_2009_124 TaxID=1250059 RepID=UPI000894B3CC|nr:SDR family oxidoreductase [Tenacibaculum sp. MAR_2009_124]SED05716.1 NAD(P)H dehydrogenase (quinone) [Tenacibaculum sp. MAR_2009_124]